MSGVDDRDARRRGARQSRRRHPCAIVRHSRRGPRRRVPQDVARDDHAAHIGDGGPLADGTGDEAPAGLRRRSRPVGKRRYLRRVSKPSFAERNRGPPTGAITEPVMSVGEFAAASVIAAFASVGAGGGRIESGPRRGRRPASHHDPGSAARRGDVDDRLSISKGSHAPGACGTLRGASGRPTRRGDPRGTRVRAYDMTGARSWAGETGGQTTRSSARWRRRSSFTVVTFSTRPVTGGRAKSPSRRRVPRPRPFRRHTGGSRARLSTRTRPSSYADLSRPTGRGRHTPPITHALRTRRWPMGRRLRYGSGHRGAARAPGSAGIARARHGHMPTARPAGRSTRSVAR